MLSSNINYTLLIREYIKALTLNVDHTKLKKEINLIFDGGAFNGGFGMGVGLYIKCLEQQGIVKINKVSGCSIGSVVALWYICGCNEKIIEYFEEITVLFKEKMSLIEYHKTIEKFIRYLFPTGDLSLLKNKLYINFYDTKKHKQKIVSRFKNVEHLIDCILQSCHIPYVINGKARYNDRYIDGIVPYIFTDHDNDNDKNRESLFIKLITLNKCTRAMVVKCESNIHYRLLIGVADANEFFTTGSSDMCSYVSQWSYLDMLQIRNREIMILFIISIIEWVVVLKSFIPATIKNSLLYNGCINSLRSFCCDVLRRTIV